MLSKNKEHVKILEYIEQFVSNSKQKMQPFIVVGELNREYIRGNQHQKISKKTKSIVPKERPSKIYLERKVHNRMLPIYLTRNGIMSANKPIPGFQPDNVEPKSVNGAIIGNRFIKEYDKQVNFGSVYKKIIKQADVFPLVFVKTGIDFTQGDLLFDGDMTVTKKDREPKVKKMKVYEGRQFVDVLPIYESFPDTIQVETMEDVREFAHRRPMGVEDVKRRYGIEIKAEPIDTNYIQKGYYTESVAHDFDNHVYVTEYFRRPCSIYEKGRYVIKIGSNHIFYSGDLPYENGAYGARDIPFDCVALQTVPGYLAGITVYSQIIDMQDTYNAIKNRVLEYLNRLAIGRKYAWKGSIVNPDGWTNKPGGVTWITRNGRPPQNEQTDRIGVEFFNSLNMIADDMLVTSGLSALQALGQSKSNMRTDGVVDKIAESDSNKLTDAIKNLSDGVMSIYKKVLYLEKFRQKILKDDFGLDNLDEFGIKYNLKDVDPEEISIVNREFLMQSDQIVEKKMLQASTLGLYNPQAGLSYRTKLETLDMLNAGYLKETLDPQQRANWSVIRREHMQLYLHKQIKTAKYEIHQMHIEEHQLEIMSESLKDLERTDNALYLFIMEELDKHIAEHQKYASESESQGAYRDAKAFM